MSNIFRKKSNQFMLPSKITTRFSFSLNNFNLSATDVFVAPDLFRTSTSPTQSAWIPQNKKKNLIYFITFQIFFFWKKNAQERLPSCFWDGGQLLFLSTLPSFFFGKKCATCTLILTTPSARFFQKKCTQYSSLFFLWETIATSTHKLPLPPPR